MSAYSDLVSDVPNWLESQSAELAAALPRIILNAQAALVSDCPVSGLHVETTGTFTVESRTIARPERLLTVEYFIAAGRGPLRQREPAWLEEYWPNRELTQEYPKYYALLDGSTIVVAPTPSLGTAYVIGHRQEPLPLTADNPDNWITDNHYSALLYAALANGADFLHDGRMPAVRDRFEARYQTEVAKIRGLEGYRITDVADPGPGRR